MQGTKGALPHSADADQDCSQSAKIEVDNGMRGPASDDLDQLSQLAERMYPV